MESLTTPAPVVLARPLVMDRLAHIDHEMRELLTDLDAVHPCQLDEVARGVRGACETWRAYVEFFSGLAAWSTA